MFFSAFFLLTATTTCLADVKVEDLTMQLRKVNKAYAAAVGISAGCVSHAKTHKSGNIKIVYWEKLTFETMDNHPAVQLVGFMEGYLEDRYPSFYNQEHYAGNFKKFMDGVDPLECIGSENSKIKSKYDTYMIISQNAAVDFYDLFFKLDKDFASLAYAHFAKNDPNVFRFVNGLPWKN